MIPLRSEKTGPGIPLVVVFIVLVNISVYFYQQIAVHDRTAFFQRFGVVPYELIHGVDLPPRTAGHPVFSLLSSLFVHMGFFHLFANMYYLWVFGGSVEEHLGSARFLLFYLTCGFFSSLLYILSAPDAVLPLIGASGAVSGVLGAYLLLCPRCRIMTVFPVFIYLQIIYVPAWLFLLLWFGIQLLEYYGLGGTVTGVAWIGHIGGFLFGAFYLMLVKAGNIVRVHD